MRRVSTKALVITGLLFALFLAGIVSYYASNSPDGLNRVAEEQGFSSTQKTHASDGSPLAGYSTRGWCRSRPQAPLPPPLTRPRASRRRKARCPAGIHAPGRRDAQTVVPAFAVCLAVLAGVIASSRLPATYILKRMVVETPFLVFALLMPFIATGPRTDFLGLHGTA